MNKSGRKILLSVAYLPPAEYFALLLNNHIVIEKHETYPKQTFRNRCHIYSEKGKMGLSIPVNKPSGNHSKITEIEILNSDRWYLRHWRAIEAAYSASPYFLYYQDMLKPFFTGEHHNLFAFDLELTKLICKIIGIEPELSFTGHFEKNPQNLTDLRYRMSPKEPPVATFFPQYIQVFSDRHAFIPNLSIIDLLFNKGPETKAYLKEVEIY